MRCSVEEALRLFSKWEEAQARLHLSLHLADAGNTSGFLLSGDCFVKEVDGLRVTLLLASDPPAIFHLAFAHVGLEYFEAPDRLLMEFAPDLPDLIPFEALLLVIFGSDLRCGIMAYPPSS